MKTKVGKVFFMLALSVFTVLLITSIATAQLIRWRAQSLFGPEDTSTTVQAKMAVDETNKALEGKLRTTLYGVGQLSPPETMTEAIARGALDAGLTVPMMRSESAGTAAFGMPFGWQNIDQVIEFYYDYGFLDFMRKVDARRNMFFAAPLPFGPITLLTKFPVNTIDDLKGKKIWSEGPAAALVEALGGASVWFDPGEVYMGLRLGTIDGVFFGTAELETMKLKEVVNYVVLPAPIDPLVVDWVVGLNSWNKLSPEVQETYDRVLRERVVRQQYEKCMISNDKGIEAAKKAGVTFITLKDEEIAKFRKASMKVWDDIAKADADGAKAVEMLKNYLKAKGVF